MSAQKAVADGRQSHVEPFRFLLSGEPPGLRPQQHVPQEPINILYICKSCNRPSIILAEGRAACVCGSNSPSQRGILSPRREEKCIWVKTVVIYNCVTTLLPMPHLFEASSVLQFVILNSTQLFPDSSAVDQMPPKTLTTAFKISLCLSDFVDFQV